MRWAALAVQYLGRTGSMEIDALLNVNGKGWEKISPSAWKSQTCSATVSGKYLVLETHAFKKHKAAQNAGKAKRN